MKIMLIPAVIFIIISGCRDQIISPEIGTENLIFNSSFEMNGFPSFAGWSLSSDDTMLITFSNDTPRNGGLYSAVLRTEWGPVHSIQTSLALNRGTYRYNFSCWSKIEGAGGSIAISHQKKDTALFLRIINITDTLWKEYSANVTVTSVENDTMKIILRGGFSHLLTGFTKFDLCRLEENR